MRPILVVGAGFSGLTLAHELNALGLKVEIFERGEKPGGMIATTRTPNGLVESAANAVLVNADIEQLFRGLRLEFAQPLTERRKRYIFWKRARRWPISLWTTFKLCKLLISIQLKRKSAIPRPHETVSAWAERNVGAEFDTRLLSPALQGVYAAPSTSLSATLVLKRFLASGSNRKGKRRGSQAPQNGMGELMHRLSQHLELNGVTIHYGHDFKLPSVITQPTVLCNSAWAAAKICEAHDPELSTQLGRCDSLPLLSATLFFTKHPSDLSGFGCLFPLAEKFAALGVLFNSSLFAGRSVERSETWILGGTDAILSKTDEEIQKLILNDRQRLTGASHLPLSVHITRWPRAIPHYTPAWEKELETLTVKRPLFLHGNYLGSLGLAQIHQQSKALAVQLKELYGN